MSAGFFKYKLIIYTEGVLVAGQPVAIDDLIAITRAAAALDPSWDQIDSAGIARRCDGRLAIGSTASLAAWRKRLGISGEVAP